MKKKTTLTVIATLFTVAVLLFILGGKDLFNDKSRTAPLSSTSPPPTQPKAALAVNLINAKRDFWSQTIHASGSIAAWQEAIVGSELGGTQLTEVLVNVGDVVKRGQLLARLSADTVRAELRQAQAQVEEAQAMLSEAQSNAARARSLEQQGFISAQQVIQSTTIEQTAQARLNAAHARLQMNLLHERQTRITAPDDGIIAARHATLGTVVQSGQELFRLIRQRRLEWRAEVDAEDVPRLQPGVDVKIHLAGTEPILGKVRITAPLIDTRTRNGLVYVDLPVHPALRAGMFAQGTFELGKTPALNVPESAVLLREGFHYVFSVDAESRARQIKVTVGRRFNNHIEIISGLPADARIVASGAGFLTDGDRVNVVGQQP